MCGVPHADKHPRANCYNPGKAALSGPANYITAQGGHHLALLSDQDRDLLKERFEVLDEPVVVKLFTESEARSLLTIPGQPQNPGGNELAKVTRELLEEVISLTPKLSLEVHDIHGGGREEAQQLGIERIPAIILGDDPKGRVRFYGAPVGNEFPTILEGIEALSTSSPKIRDEIVDALAEHVTEPVNLKVFVTPT